MKINDLMRILNKDKELFFRYRTDGITVYYLGSKLCDIKNFNKKNFKIVFGEAFFIMNDHNKDIISKSDFKNSKEVKDAIECINEYYSFQIPNNKLKIKYNIKKISNKKNNNNKNEIENRIKELENKLKKNNWCNEVDIGWQSKSDKNGNSYQVKEYSLLNIVNDWEHLILFQKTLYNIIRPDTNNLMYKPNLNIKLVKISKNAFEEEDIIKLISAMKTMIKKYYSCSTKLEEKNFQRFLMESHNLSEIFGKDYLAYEEEFCLSKNDNDNAGRVDNLYIVKDNNEYKVNFVEVKINDAVISGTNGIKKHLNDIYKALQKGNSLISTIQDNLVFRNKFIQEVLNEPIYGSYEENGLVRNELTKDKSKFYIICGYSDNNKDKVINKIKEENENSKIRTNFDGLFKEIDNLGCEVKLVLINAHKENGLYTRIDNEEEYDSNNISNLLNK